MSVRSVTLAFAILRLVGQRGALTLSDVARATATSPSSCLNVLRTLVAEGALVLGDGKRYDLAPGWRAVGGLLESAQAKFVARAQPLIARFAETHDVAGGLWRVEPRGRIALVALGESRAATRIHMVVGQRQPLGGGSAGRALAAHERPGDAELARRFAAVRWRRPLGLDDYIAQVQEARSRGYAVDDGYAYVGICSVACVVGRAAPAFCLSASMFAGTRGPDELAALGKALTGLAEELAVMADGVTDDRG
jgi:DNA-binding IclR family transcriptional regulator